MPSRCCAGDKQPARAQAAGSALTPAHSIWGQAADDKKEKSKHFQASANQAILFEMEFADLDQNERGDGGALATFICPTVRPAARSFGFNPLPVKSLRRQRSFARSAGGVPGAVIFAPFLGLAFPLQVTCEQAVASVLRAIPGR
jgi:hypothetical protein